MSKIQCILFTILWAIIIPGAHAGLFDSYGHCVELTFTGYEGSESLQAFPALVSVTNFMGFSYTQVKDPNGADLRFTDATGDMELNYEIDTWNTNGASLVWVQVPQLTGTGTKILAYWGNASATAPVYASDGSTWSNGYVAVYHLGETSGTLADSGALTNALTTFGDTQQGTEGMAGLAPRFPDGSNDWLQAPDHDALDGMAQLTLEAWIYDEKNDTSPRAILSKRTDASTGKAYYLYKGANRNTHFLIGSAGGEFTGTATGDNQWYHLAATYDKNLTADRMKIFLDGAFKKSGNRASGNVPATTANLHVGTLNASYGFSWQGKIDEARVSNVSRSADWLRATWKTIADNTGFATYGEAKSAILKTDAATQVAATAATLNATMSWYSSAPAAVTVFWGAADKGTDAVEWDQNFSFDPYSGGMPATFSHAVSGLAPGAWFVRHRCVTAEGTSWSPASTVFITGEVSIQATTPNVPETGPGTGVFTVSRSAGTNVDSTVAYAVAGTATPEEDYTALTGAVTIPAGASSAEIAVAPILDYDAAEGAETVVLTLLPGAYVLGTATQTVVTISDFVSPASGTTNVWIGTGNASTDANWSLGHAPTSGEHVLLTGFSTASLTWDAAATPEVQSWSQTADYSGTATFQTRYGTIGFTNFVIAGDCVLAGGKWNHTANGSTETYRLRVTVGGDFALSGSAAVDVSQCGYAADKGPGARVTNSFGDAASFGGTGGDYYSSGGVKMPYGCSVSEPTELGSGGYQNGGGAVHLTVGGSLRMEAGTAISSRGGGRAAGGSIFVKADALEGTGTISANGGTGGGGGYGGGGGGRVAVVLMEATSFDAFIGAIAAYGQQSLSNEGKPTDASGAAGTVFKQTAASDDNGTLIIDNNNIVPRRNWWDTLLPAGVDLAEFSRVIITNKGVLAVNGDNPLDLANATIIGSGLDNAALHILADDLITYPATWTLGTNYTILGDGISKTLGNVVVPANGRLSHAVNFGAELLRLDVDIAGNLTVESGGAIQAYRAGYAGKSGPGSLEGVAGGSHGGRGSTTTTPAVDPSAYPPTYGSVHEPVNMGSGGRASGLSFAGGGAIKLTVGGATTIEDGGSISANGGTAAAGGSVWLTTGELLGAGVIEARGGNNGNGAGGGGRISVCLTESDADLAGFDGQILAQGGTGSGSGSAGTLYWEKAAQTGGRGTLLVANNNLATFANLMTPLLASINPLPDALRHATVNVADKGQIDISADTAVGNLFLAEGTTLDLGFHTLFVDSARHDLDGAVLNEGEIVWAQPETIIVIR